MKSFGRSLCLVVLLLSAASNVFAQSWYDVGKAFVWRINPSDYFFAEARFGEWFSLTNDLIFALTDKVGTPNHALALVKKSEKFYQVSLYDYPNPLHERSAATELRQRTALIDARIAQQIEAAVSFRIHGLVLLDPKPKNPEGYELGAWWIFQRAKQNKIETALISRDATHMNQPASAFLQSIIGNLRDYVESSPENRPEIAALLEAAAIPIAKGELPERY